MLALEAARVTPPPAVRAALAATAALSAVWVVLRVLLQMEPGLALLGGLGAAMYMGALVRQDDGQGGVRPRRQDRIAGSEGRHDVGDDGRRQARDGVRSRDDHLRSTDFINSAEFPDMVFKSTRFNFNGDNVESIEGNLTRVGVTKPIKFNVSSFKCAPHPVNKNPMCGAYVEGVVKRSDFGMKFGVPAISDDVKLAISVEAYPK